MDSKIKTLSQCRFEKAKEDLEAATVNFDNGLIKASINRSYYAIFHSIRSVNALDEFDSKKHSGVIAYFNQYYIHSGKFEKETYNMITSAYRIREKSDYDDFYVAAKDDAQEQLENAKRFLGIVENYLEKNNII